MSVKLFEFHSAVRGYHCFQKYWVPEAKQDLDRTHGVDYPYNYFAIKTCARGTKGRTAGHLPMNVSRFPKYIFQRGATVVATISSTNFIRKSPLVQGGLKIPCCVATFMPETLKNKEIIQKYKDMVYIMYTEPDAGAVVGSFVHYSINEPLYHQKNKSNQTPKESSVGSRKKKRNPNQKYLNCLHNFKYDSTQEESCCKRT